MDDDECIPADMVNTELVIKEEDDRDDHLQFITLPDDETLAGRNSDERLIEYVRQYPALYDMTDPRYMESKYKTLIWETIAKELHISSTRCRTRWSNIRDQFKKSLRLRNYKLGGPLNKRYKYEHHLKFLLDAQHFQLRVYGNNSQEKEDSDESTGFTNEQNEVTESVAENNDVVFSRKRKHIDSTPFSSKTRKLCDNYDPTDHVDAFLVGIAATLRRLPPYFQHLAKGKIFTTVHELESAALFVNKDGASVDSTAPVSNNKAD